jgi:prepilin-type N-terminal cleavage/methylation domain-containing protein
VAFSLIEVLVGVAILGLVIFSLYSGISAGFAMMRLAREQLRATQILADKMETIRLYRWDQINSNGFIPPTFVLPFYATNQATNEGVLYYGKVTITNAGLTEVYNPDMRLVLVEVQWYSGTRPRTRSMSTLVSRYGLQNYVY